MHLNLAKNFYDQGYDIYNLSSDFYNEKCTPSNINNSDIIISDRIKEIYPLNVLICPNNCFLDNVDIENKRVNCICNISNINISYESNNNKSIENDNIMNLDKDELVKSFTDLNMINIDVLKCNKLLFKLEGLLYNIGSYIIIFIFIIYLINIIIFYARDYNRLFNIIKIIIKNGNILRNSSSNKENKNIIKKK